MSNIGWMRSTLMAITVNLVESELNWAKYVHTIQRVTTEKMINQTLRYIKIPHVLKTGKINIEPVHYSIIMVAVSYNESDSEIVIDTSCRIRST